MSDILKTVHTTTVGLHQQGAIDKVTMRKFSNLCLTQIHDFSPDQVKQIREKYHLSQPVFAQHLNVSGKLVKKWEQGVSSPKGAALKLLVLAEKEGLEAIA